MMVGRLARERCHCPNLRAEGLEKGIGSIELPMFANGLTAEVKKRLKMGKAFRHEQQGR
jgi:hypothetical protein